MKYKIGQIYFIKSEGDLFSNATTFYNNKIFPNEKWLPTHVGIIAEVDVMNEQGEDCALIYESTGAGFKSSLYPNYWLDNRIKEGKVKIGECSEKLTNVLENCETYKDISYGWLDILGLAIHYIFKIDLFSTGKNKIICSEAVNYVIYDSTKTINFAAEFGLSPDEITPAHIFKSKQQRIVS